MNEDRIPQHTTDDTQANPDADSTEVEGHYMNGYAAEKEASLHQQRLMNVEKRRRDLGDAAAQSLGIVDRIRRRLDR
jgi:hypothetical protein